MWRVGVWVAVIFLLVLPVPSVLAAVQYINTLEANISIGNSNEVFVDTTGAKVGIGTVSPAYNLEVSEDAANPSAGVTSDGDYFPQIFLRRINAETKDNRTWKFQITSGGKLAIVDRGEADISDSIAMTIDDDTRNVGIGTTTPGSKLEVAGVGNFSAGGIVTGSSVAGTGAIRLNAGAFQGFNGSEWLSISNGSDTTQWTSNGADIYYNSGDVGIGTTSPTQELEIESSDDEVGLQLNSPGGQQFRLFGRDSDRRFGIYDVSNSLSFLRYAGADTAPDRILNFLETGGKVGVGTISPLSTLHVNGSGASGGLRVTNESGNTTFFVNSTSGNIGIGTTDPVNLLTLEGTGVNTRMRINRLGDGTSIFGVDGSGRAVVLGESGIGFWVGAVGSESNKVSINGSGSVGIGTTDPQYLLELFGSTDGSARGELAISDGNNGAGATGRTLILQSPYDSEGAARITLDGTTADITVGPQDYPDLLHLEGSNGNVGIGITSPDSPLTFAGTTGQKIHLYGTQSSGYSLGVESKELRIAGGTGSDNFIAFRTQGYSGTERVRIDSDGNVGIGETSPGARLHVEKPSNSGKGLIVQGGSSNSDNHFEWQTSGGSAQGVIDYLGRLGIGTADPAAPLHVSDDDTSYRHRFTSTGDVVFESTDGGDILQLIDAGATDATDANPVMEFLHTTAIGGGLNRLGYVGYGSTSSQELIVINEAAADGISFRTGGNNPRVTIDENGDVGIGTGSPDYKTQVMVSDTNVALALSTDTDNNGDYSTLSFRTVNEGVTDREVGNIKGERVNANDGRLSLGVRAGGSFDQDNLVLYQGNVGIGAATPDNALHVVSGNRLVAKIESTDNANSPRFAGLSFVDPLTTGDARITSFNGDALALWTGASGSVDIRTVIDSSGNVGIGVENPTQKLHVDGNITLTQNHHIAFGTDFGIRENGEDIEFFEPEDTGSSPQSNLGGHVWMKLMDGGTVGIGTTNPDEGKLEVKGGTVCVDTNSDDIASSCIASESDARLKENVTTLTGSLDTLMQLRGVSFDWRVNDPDVLKHYPLIARFNESPRSVGMIAQEVQAVLPEAVMQETIGDNTTRYLQLDYDKFVPLLVESVKELKRENEALGEEVSALRQSLCSHFPEDEICTP